MLNLSTVYTFRIDAGVSFVKMLNERVFAAVYAKDVKIGVLPHLGLPFKISMSQVSKMKKIER